MKTVMTVVIAGVLGIGLAGCGEGAGSTDQVKVVRAPTPSPTPHVGDRCTYAGGACDDAATAHARGEKGSYPRRHARRVR